LLLLGEILSRGNRYGEAIAIAKQGLALDPNNPELHILKSTALAQLGDVDRAIEAVVIDPHAIVRAGLQTHFTSLAKIAGQRNEAKQQSRYIVETAFVAIADLLGTGDPEALKLIADMNRELAKQTKDLERTSVDPRYLVTAALASKYAEVWKLRGVQLKPWQAAILGKQLDRLRAVPGWGSLPASTAGKK